MQTQEKMSMPAENSAHLGHQGEGQRCENMSTGGGRWLYLPGQRCQQTRKSRRWCESQNQEHLELKRPVLRRGRPRTVSKTKPLAGDGWDIHSTNQPQTSQDNPSNEEKRDCATPGHTWRGRLWTWILGEPLYLLHMKIIYIKSSS